MAVTGSELAYLPRRRTSATWATMVQTKNGDVIEADLVVPRYGHAPTRLPHRLRAMSPGYEPERHHPRGCHHGSLGHLNVYAVGT